MAQPTVRLKGYREFLRACDRAGKETKREVRGEFRRVGEGVQTEATQRFSRYDARSAAGYRVRVRQRGVAVEQSLRKTTGLRPGYGRLQMTRALLPAMDAQAPETERRLEQAIDRVADHFERG